MSAVIAHLQLPAAPTRPCTLSLTLGLLSGHFTALVIVDHNVIAVAHHEDISDSMLVRALDAHAEGFAEHAQEHAA